MLTPHSELFAEKKHQGDNICSACSARIDKVTDVIVVRSWQKFLLGALFVYVMSQHRLGKRALPRIRRRRHDGVRHLLIRL